EQIKARQTAQQAIRLNESEYDKVEQISELEKEMLEAAETLDFERAAFLRDQLRQLKDLPKLDITDKNKHKTKKRARGK
ncbi:MAG: UvrB/UvrC motif-containing protein, partial [Planctomycetota bacterium]